MNTPSSFNLFDIPSGETVRAMTSQQVVKQILDGPNDERRDRFIQVVQASDLSGLVNALDDRLVDFVRGVLSS